MNIEPTVYIVDDDADALDSLQCLLQSVGLRTRAYDSPSLFLEDYDATRPGCVVLDIRMPEMSGLVLQEELARRGNSPPIIVVTGHADVPVCAAAFRMGAFDFIEKPANQQLLLGRIQRAIEQDGIRRRSVQQAAELEQRRQQLTPREREVMDMIVDGQTLKQIAVALSISVQTASKHRTRVLEKMQVTTDVALAWLVLPTAAMQDGSCPVTIE